MLCKHVRETRPPETTFSFILKPNTCVRDMFHVYLNRSEYDFLWLHIIKTNTFCFFMHNERVPVITK